MTGRKNVLQNSSGSNIFNSEYKVCSFYLAKLKHIYKRKILSVRSSVMYGQVQILPGFWPDMLVFSVDPVDKTPIITIVEYLGSWHLLEKNDDGQYIKNQDTSHFHQSNCPRFSGRGLQENVMFTKAVCRIDLAVQALRNIYEPYFKIEVTVVSPCIFHSKITFGETEFEDFSVAFKHLRLTYPDLCLSADLPKLIDVRRSQLDENTSIQGGTISIAHDYLLSLTSTTTTTTFFLSRGYNSYRFRRRRRQRPVSRGTLFWQKNGGTARANRLSNLQVRSGSKP